MWRMRHIEDPEGVQFPKSGQAIRGMARAIRSLPLTEAEQRAFTRWYTYRQYRSVALALHSGRRYEFAVSVNGTRQTYVIESLPVTPENPAPHASLPPEAARGGSEAPGRCPP